MSSEVSVDPACRESALRLESLMRQECFDSLVRQQAKARVEFVRNEVLSDPATARLYLLLSADALGGKGVQKEALEGLLEEASWWTPQNRWLVIARMVHKYVAGMSSEKSAELVKAFSVAAEALGDLDFAQRIREEAGGDAEIGKRPDGADELDR
ncbi:hypothetical protein [Micromonospora sp. NPDC023814]|uniref:hypothetical protein n=1 Tax=Micromonospora sp. NPDC023814 TaxID=3154596 RepID=UPI0033F52D81